MSEKCIGATVEMIDGKYSFNKEELAAIEALAASIKGGLDINSCLSEEDKEMYISVLESGKKGLKTPEISLLIDTIISKLKNPLNIGVEGSDYLAGGTGNDVLVNEEFVPGVKLKQGEIAPGILYSSNTNNLSIVDISKYPPDIKTKITINVLSINPDVEKLVEVLKLYVSKNPDKFK